jgi:hypothetical protein
MDGPGSIPDSARFFLFSTASSPTLGLIQLLIQWVEAALSPGLKQEGREADR